MNKFTKQLALYLASKNSSSINYGILCCQGQLKIHGKYQHFFLSQPEYLCIHLILKSNCTLRPEQSSPNQTIKGKALPMHSGPSHLSQASLSSLSYLADLNPPATSLPTFIRPEAPETYRNPDPEPYSPRMSIRSLPRQDYQG